jgi:hypothetical protein
MASYDADLAVRTDAADVSTAGVVSPFGIDLLDFQIPARYEMRARDANASELTYRRWTAYAEPDFTAATYPGEYTGATRNLVEVAVVAIEE